MVKFARSALALLAVTALASACATVPATDANSWSYAPSEGGGAARLYYGEPDSDVVWLGFACTPKGGAELLVFVDEDPANWPKTMALRSGGSTLAVKAEPDPETEVAILRSRIDAAAPTIAAFARTGRLQSVWDGHPNAVGARTPDERLRIASFWRDCARP